jgi:para-aminobenzoate synthetase component 1
MPGMMHWLYQHRHFAFFNGNQYDLPYNPFKTFAAAGSIKTLMPDSMDPFNDLKEFYDSQKDWIVGRLNYDLKNNLENLTSNNSDRLESDGMHFFVPETIIFIQQKEILISTVHDPVKVFDEIANFEIPAYGESFLQIKCDTSKKEYINAVKSIKNQIVKGDFYELNYCLEFFTKVKNIDLASIYLQLNEISPMPFSVFMGLAGQYIVSASPERFLKKDGRKILAQPIKGTMKRDSDPVLDEKLKQQLRHSEKEIAENMMIVDLMRNDLARSADPASTAVPEMFEIYSYKHVHQMISTVTARLRSDIHPVDSIRNAFPMGSMTGAPKIKVMEAIDYYEKSKRGMFSGSTGYFTPDGDFDFNVLIRSIFYSTKTGYLKFNAGSAITYDADPESEYQECILKTRSMREALGVSSELGVYDPDAG